MMSFLAAALMVYASPSKPAVPLERKTMSLEAANQLAGSAIGACRALGQSAVVAVVDRGGNLVALQRGDDVGPHNTLAAQRKAFTALSTKTRTAVLAERAASDPTVRNLTTLPELLLLGGGVPVMVGLDTIGAVGVAGAGGAANDERCAVQAISQVIGSTQR